MQNYKNHAKLTPAYHVVLFLCVLLYMVAAVINLYRHWPEGRYHLQPLLFVGAGIIFFVLMFLLRSFPLKAQDRVIRAEENMRHYVLTGKQLDHRLSMSQVIALRFASDAEFPALAQRAVAENLPAKEIKQAVQNWRADNHRM